MRQKQRATVIICNLNRGIVTYLVLGTTRVSPLSPELIKKARLHVRSKEMGPTVHVLKIILRNALQLKKNACIRVAYFLQFGISFCKS